MFWMPPLKMVAETARPKTSCTPPLSMNALPATPPCETIATPPAEISAAARWPPDSE
jgi:hypothetical protein